LLPRVKTMPTIMTSQTPTACPEAAAYSLRPGVALLLVEDGTARLLDMEGQVYAVSGAGGEMLQRTLERGTQAAVREIAAQHSVDAGQVEADLRGLLHELEQHGLVRRGRGDPGRPRPAARFAGRLLGTVLRWLDRGVPALETRAWLLLALARL